MLETEHKRKFFKKKSQWVNVCGKQKENEELEFSQNCNSLRKNRCLKKVF